MLERPRDNQSERHRGHGASDGASSRLLQSDGQMCRAKIYPSVSLGVAATHACQTERSARWTFTTRARCAVSVFAVIQTCVGAVASVGIGALRAASTADAQRVASMRFYLPVLYFACTFNENTARLRHTHMHLSTCTLYKHLSTFTLGIHPQHQLSS